MRAVRFGMGLGDEKYILLTTFRKDSTPVPTPIWIVALDDGTFGCWTSSGSGKAKRLRQNPAVTVQPCDMRGRVTAGTEPFPATVRLVAASDPEFGSVQAKIRAKYGVMTKITHALGVIGGIVKRKRIPYGDRCIIITL
jgi:PPOX class probable F420-dependent enzyme